MASPYERYRVRPGSQVSLGQIDTEDTGDWKKKAAKARLAELKPLLTDLQEQLFATGKHGLLIVLQGMDTAGKDGVIKHAIDGFNPRGCHVASFGVPTEEELAHDYLWRIHKETPGRGMVGVFNRSHYEDVLVVRVESLVPESVWRPRYKSINEFEKWLADSGIVVLKFYLHISPKEQQERLADRLVNPNDQWKFRMGDLKVRNKWQQYREAYEEAIEKSSTDYAPWYVIPADKKWYRNMVVAEIIKAQLEALGMEWPPLEEEAQGLDGIPEVELP